MARAIVRMSLDGPTGQTALQDAKAAGGPVLRSRGRRTGTIEGHGSTAELLDAISNVVNHLRTRLPVGITPAGAGRTDLDRGFFLGPLGTMERQRSARFADIKKRLGTRVAADPLILVADSSGKPIASAGGGFARFASSIKKERRSRQLRETA